MSDADDLLFGNKVPSWAPEPKMEIKGRVISWTTRQRNRLDYNSGTKRYDQGPPLFWKDKKIVTEETDRPVMDNVLTVATAWRDNEGISAYSLGDDPMPDDGDRRIFVRGRASAASTKDALLNACKKAGVRKILPGDYVRMVCTGEGKKPNPAANPPKLFEAEYWTAANPPAWAAEIEADLPGEITEDDVFA